MTHTTIHRYELRGEAQQVAMISVTTLQELAGATAREIHEKLDSAIFDCTEVSFVADGTTGFLLTRS